MSRVKRLSLTLVAFVACAPYRPPFTQPLGASVPTDPHQAALVFFWPSTSCDPAGYFTLATADGQFIGNISRGSRLSVLVPAGERAVIAWNNVMEAATGSFSKATVPVLHADLREGRTYYVRMVFGEWDEGGPYAARGGPYARGGAYPAPRCVRVSDSATSAMVALPPGLVSGLEGLEAIVPDRAAGQAWLDGNRALLESHLAVGQDRFRGLRPEAKRQATIEPADGAPQ